ncbi:Cysteine protease atg4b [Linnemannia exigua]|uniref:Autophagy-related protein 4 n=1 Tax=Linnemannia exigua TaxID=604196 RepID=A0AAD4H2H5_9FUNG|nr:Cysteine protease atg4b [Linnemannia exigua]
MDKRPPTSLPLPLLPLEVRPAFSRSKSQQNLASPTRLYNTVSSALGRSRVDLLSSPSSEQPPAVPPIPVHYAPAPSAFATMQKVYQSSEDMSFWSTLYAQHKVHTRQENQREGEQHLQPQLQQQQGSSEKTSTAAAFTSTFGLAAEHLQQQQHRGDATGSIKVWQVLTKTVLDNNTTATSKPTPELQSYQQQQQQQQQQQLQQPLPQLYFERLPIKVQTSATALSTNGQPFSVVFFFTVDASPITLWYLESAFTQSATVHEHMELMGTFQPNNPRDPTSFYIYETHTFNIVQPTQEDTMLDIHVQNPDGIIYAEFSYTFIKEPRVSGSASSAPSMPNSPRTATRMEKNSCRSINDTNGITPATATTTSKTITKLVEMPLSPVQSPLDGYDLVERESPSSPGYFPVFKDESSPSYSSSPSPSSSTKRIGSNVPSLPSSSVISESSTQTSILQHPVTLTGIEQDDEEIHNNDQEEPEAVFVESLSEEPDAGEHFMQATSEFFSKMGYWLYNSKMIQYIARDDRTRIKTQFQTDDIWILGVSYTFDQSEPPLSLHEAPRSRKSSMLQAHAFNSNRSGGGNGGGAGVGGVCIGVGGGVSGGVAIGGGASDPKGSSIGSQSPGSDHSTHEQTPPKRLLERPRSHTVSSPRTRADSDAQSRMSTFSRRQDSYMEPPRSKSKERKLEKQREKELAKEAARAKKLARVKERELEKEQERQQERERAKEKSRLKELEKIQKFKAKISHPHFDRNSSLDGSRHHSVILAVDSKDQGYLNVRQEPERKSQSIHGYQQDYRANVGLGLSTPTDTAEPNQQEGEEAKEYPHEPVPSDPSPEHSPPPPGDRPRSARQRLLNLPSALLTNLPRQRSPSSPREYPSGILDLDDTSETRPEANGTTRRDLSSSSRFSTSSHLSVERPVSLPASSPNRATLTRFMADFQSRIWFTYRKEISRIEPSFYTSDAGWGCMMRTGQSLLAQAFVQVMLGRDWLASPLASEESRQKYCTILSWFADEPDRYYSIHGIARMGVALDKRVGEWFGPSTVAHALRRLSYKHSDCPVAVMVSMDGTIDISELANVATGKGSHAQAHGMAPPGSPDPQRQTQQQPGKWKPVVVMMPVRFGLDKLKEGYVTNLKHLFKLPQFLGIAGGRPGRSLYFVACQGNDLFYFDPHSVKPRATHEEMSYCPSSSYHCNVVRTMDVMELDPSMMLGFLIRSMQDLVDLQVQLKQVMEKRYSLFSITGNLTVPSAAPVAAPGLTAALGEPSEKADVVAALSEKAAVAMVPKVATVVVESSEKVTTVVELSEMAAVVVKPRTAVADVTHALVDVTSFDQAMPEEEEETVVEEVLVIADETLEQEQLDHKDGQLFDTPVVIDEDIDRGKEEEKEIVEEGEEEEEIVVVIVSPHDTKLHTTATPAITTATTIPNLDAPLPPLPNEREAPVPAPPLLPVSTGPIESRPKKEMRRITKAFQKEKWMVKPRSNKNKKGSSSPPVEEASTTTVVDKIIYKFATTTGEEDAVMLHNEDTLSVKSFDSDLSL